MEIALHKLSVSRGKVTTLRIRNVNVQRNLNKGGESGLVCPQKTILHVVLARCLHYLCHLLHERSWQLATGNWLGPPRGAHYTSLGTTTTGTLPLVFGTFFIGFVCFSVIESGNFPSSLPPVMFFTVLRPLCAAAWGVNCKGFGAITPCLTFLLFLLLLLLLVLILVELK